MKTLDANMEVSPELVNVITTRATPPDELANGEEERERRRVGWDKIIDQNLVEWGRNPSVLDDEDLVPPTREIIDQACLLASAMRDANFPPPLRVCPDGDGGICFEHKAGEWFRSTEISNDGRIDLSTFRDCKLVSRQRLN